MVPPSKLSRSIRIKPRQRASLGGVLARARHPAGLNYGDCFAYALARSRPLPLLFQGDDFSLTDIDGVPPLTAPT
jgi:uncharacterized protein with PIN domain